MHVMEEKKNGSFAKDIDIPAIGIRARHSDSYSTVINRAVEAFPLVSRKQKLVKLFMVRGTMILNVPNEEGEPWSLGEYLILRKKSPDELKLGVGYVSCTKV